MSRWRRSRSGAPPPSTLTRESRPAPTRTMPPTSRACVGVRTGTACVDARVRRDRLVRRRVVEPLERADRAVVRRKAGWGGVSLRILRPRSAAGTVRTAGAASPVLVVVLVVGLVPVLHPVLEQAVQDDLVGVVAVLHRGRRGRLGGRANEVREAGGVAVLEVARLVLDAV